MKMKDFKTYLFAFIAYVCGFTTVVAQEKIKVYQKPNRQYASKTFTGSQSFYYFNSKFPNRSVAPFNLETRYIKQNQAEAKYAYIKH
jgi:hypothetical protein